MQPYAVLLQGKEGRTLHEPSDARRNPFQRDRDRIVHTQAFRRLQGKTQVFCAGSYDHVRTRLTHTMEVALISRDLARGLGLNEDLAECIALAHDLGHPPFGHSGEEALNLWAQKYHLSFEHNLQSHRIVTVLERHSSLTEGLNLNMEVLEGLLKHETPHDTPDSVLDHAPSLEAMVVNLADEIAYTAHDCEDGIEAGLFTLEELCSVPLALQAHTARTKRGTSLRGALIEILTDSIYTNTPILLTQHSIATLADVYAAQSTLVTFDSAMRRRVDTLRIFLWDHMYMHTAVKEMSDRGKNIVTSLCDQCVLCPPKQVLDLQTKLGTTLHEAVIDYVAGMTDKFATDFVV